MKIRWYKVKAMMYRDFLVFSRSRWKLVDVFYFPITTIIIWGLFAIYTKDFTEELGLTVLMINIFWSFSFVSQSTVNQNMNEDMWSGSLKQILSSGISPFEYIFSRIVSSIVISSVLISVLLSVSWYFGFRMLFSHFWIVLSLVGITLLASIAMSILVAALVFFLGRKYSFLAWTALQAFILLSSPLWPLEILPDTLRLISLVMPYTMVFMGVRELVGTGLVNHIILIEGLITAAVYLALAFPFYLWSFKRAKKTGELARLT